MRRATVLLAAAAAVVAWSLATPVLACDGHKAEAAAVAKAEEAKPVTAEAKGGCAKAEAAVETAAATPEAKGGCPHAAAAAAAMKASADGEKKGCAKKVSAATLAKNEEIKKAEETK